MSVFWAVVVVLMSGRGEGSRHGGAAGQDGRRRPRARCRERYLAWRGSRTSRRQRPGGGGDFGGGNRRDEECNRRAFVATAPAFPTAGARFGFDLGCSVQRLLFHRHRHFPPPSRPSLSADCATLAVPWLAGPAKEDRSLIRDAGYHAGRTGFAVPARLGQQTIGFLQPTSSATSENLELQKGRENRGTDVECAALRIRVLPEEALAQDLDKRREAL